MNTDTEHRPADSPPDRFEDRLLASILVDFDQLTAEPAGTSPPAPHRRRVPPRPRTRVAVMAVVAGVLLAGVATALAVGGGSGRRLPTAPPHGPAVRTGAAPSAQRRDTAYIIRRVRADLARLAVAGEGQVLERRSTIGDGTAGSPAVHNTDWAYIDPRSGIAYQRSVDRSANGTVLAVDELITTPIDHVLRSRVTFVDPSRRTYLTTRNAPGPFGSVASATSGTQLGIKSTARQIDQALSSHTVTREGTATVDGQSAIKLSVPPASLLVKAGLPRQTRITLYVNAQTYQPVQEVEVVPDVHDPSAGSSTAISRWLPSTAASIALAKLRIPAGYTQVSAPLSRFLTNAKPLFFIGY